ncbi:MAG: InlB B-repeat-containing protein, partial [Clostridia bacterium]|nr:InlB B-repeat-containing protein [Clostridia bacterium]
LHNAVTDTYTTARTYCNATKQVNEYDETKAPIELTPTEENVYYLSTFGDDMYVSPKVGTQIGAYTLDTQEVSGTVFFEYANGVLAVKTTTYDVQGRDDASLKASGNGQTITLGTVETDLSKGYTISVGSAPSIDTGNGEKSYQYSSSVIITKINDVLFSDGTVSSENGAVTDIRYGTETVVRGDAAISIREGDELKTFDVYAKFKVGGALSSVTSSKVYEISATETFAGKQAGEYPLTVSAGGFDKTYTVFVEKTYEVSSGEILSSEENAKLTLNSKLGDYKGVLLDRVTEGNPARTANVNGVFSNSASVSFLFEKGIASGTEGHEFVVFDCDGNEVASAVHYYVQAWQGGGARAYVRDRLTDTYMKPKSDGSYEKMTALETSMYGGVNVAPIPYATNSAINYDGTYYDVETAAGTIYFEYDKAECTLTVKISTPQKTRLAPDHEKNVGKIENLASPARIVTVGVVKNVDLSDGYTLGIREAVDFKDGDGQFSTPSAKMLILDVNGVSLADNSVKVTSGGIVFADFLGEEYSFNPTSEEETKFYLAQNGSLNGLTVTALKKFADGWVERVTAQNATLVSENGYDDVGEYSVDLVAELDGISYVTPIKLVVENSAKVTFDSKGGTAFVPVYVSAHNWNHALPTPERFGWIFTGWYNGDNLVETLSDDFVETTLVAKWLDETPPVVNLNGLQSVTVVDNAAKFKIEKSDVLAEDMAWGLLGDEYITVRVKAPVASEFVSLENFTFNSEFGEYEIVYSVKDGSGNSAEISRILKYMPTRPVLTVEGSFPEKGYVNEKILLPAANAKSGENTIAYSVSVVCDGVETAVENGAFVPVTTGTYSVVYAAVDDNGLTAVETFEILIVEDVTAPV